MKLQKSVATLLAKAITSGIRFNTCCHTIAYTKSAAITPLYNNINSADRKLYDDAFLEQRDANDKTKIARCNIRKPVIFFLLFFIEKFLNFAYDHLDVFVAHIAVER